MPAIANVPRGIVVELHVESEGRTDVVVVVRLRRFQLHHNSRVGREINGVLQRLPHSGEAAAVKGGLAQNRQEGAGPFEDKGPRGLSARDAVNLRTPSVRVPSKFIPAVESEIGEGYRRQSREQRQWKNCHEVLHRRKFTEL